MRVVRVVDATGETQRLRMHEVAMDPGFVKLDWVFADRDRDRVVPVSKVIDATWEAPDGSVVALDGVLDSFYQEVYLDPDSQVDVRAAGAARLARRAGELPRPDRRRDRQVLRRGSRELRQGRQAALQHHPHPAARRRRVVPAAALRRPAGAALPGRRHHARPQRGDPGRPARPRDDRRAARGARGHHRRLLHRRGPRGDHRPGTPPARDGRGRAARGRRPHRRRRPTPRSAATSSRRSRSRQG